MREAEVIELLMHVVEAPPASLGEAHELEAALIHATDIDGVEEFGVALSLYEPTDMPSAHLIGFDGLRSAAREALHDLGHHECCLHDRPLMERP